jgi:hypothetical protein
MTNTTEKPVFIPMETSSFRILVIPAFLSFRGTRNLLSNYSISFVCVKLSFTLRRSLLRRDDKHNGKTCFHSNGNVICPHSCESRILVIPAFLSFRGTRNLRPNYSISFVSVKLSFTLRRSLLRRDDKHNGKTFSNSN